MHFDEKMNSNFSGPKALDLHLQTKDLGRCLPLDESVSADHVRAKI